MTDYTMASEERFQAGPNGYKGPVDPTGGDIESGDCIPKYPTD